jgi:ElaB/YqjD/DUF883 family membrane-anchored ribosome-binding protein
MTDTERTQVFRSTTSAMRDTAEQLEEAEAKLHRSAEASPVAATRQRLHQLGDEVTAEAHGIEDRADDLGDRSTG